MPITPIPAETFRVSTHHTSQNCGVLCAFVEMHVSLRDHRIGIRRRSPAFRAPANRRDTVAERADHHEDEIDQAHRDEGFPDADRGRGLEVIHQQIGERRADHGAATESHDGHAGRHAAPVRKPFDQRRDRRDVTEAEADAADHAGAEPHQPELMDVDAERAEISRPPHQHSAATTPALRGPTRSSQPPQSRPRRQARRRTG